MRKLSERFILVSAMETRYSNSVFAPIYFIQIYKATETYHKSFKFLVMLMTGSVCRISVPQFWTCWRLMMCVSWQRAKTSWVAKEILSESFPLTRPPATSVSSNNSTTSIFSSTSGSKNTGSTGAKVCVGFKCDFLVVCLYFILRLWNSWGWVISYCV